MKIFLIILSLVMGAASFAQNGPAVSGPIGSSGSAMVVPGAIPGSIMVDQEEVIIDGPSKRNVDTIIPADDTSIRGMGDLDAQPSTRRQNLNKTQRNQSVETPAYLYYNSDVEMRYQEITD